MARQLLILGGSSFVGRALASEALAREFAVTTFNRGQTAAPVADGTPLRGDRRIPGDLQQLADRDWDLVIDTWDQEPSAVLRSTETLRDHAGFYAYISSGSVYTQPPPTGASESAETVPAAPDQDDGDYSVNKRGGELAVEHAFPGRMLLARAGTIVGPYENTGRLTWWLSRMARGGEVLCPGPRENPIQYVDARDLARFVISAAEAGQDGPFNVVSRRGHTTMGFLLEACQQVSGASDSELVWVDPDAITRRLASPASLIPQQGSSPPSQPDERSLAGTQPQSGAIHGGSPARVALRPRGGGRVWSADRASRPPPVDCLSLVLAALLRST